MVIMANPVAAKLTGLPSEGFSLSEFIRLFQGKIAIDLEKTIEQVLANGKAAHIEEVCIVSFFYEMFIAPVFDAAANVTGGFILLRDLTKEKVLTKDLEKFKLAVDNVSDQIIITDPDATVLYINDATEKITGYASKEALGGKAGKLWGNLMAKSFYENLWKTIKIDKKTFVGEIVNQRKNKQKYTALISISPILDEKGEIEFFVGIERDITKEKEIERAKTEFVSLASHQLRTPITAIRLSLESLQQRSEQLNLPLDDIEIISRAKAYANGMSRTINTMLNVTRIEAGETKVVPTEVSVEQLLTEVWQAFSTEVQNKHQSLSIDCAPMIHRTDASLLREILNNFLSNAIKYTPDGGKIRLHAQKERGDTLHMDVEDTGSGIKQEEQKKIFTKFFCGGEMLTLSKGGTGLGLYLVQSIVTLLKGRVTFTSQPGKGTVFHVFLPPLP